MYLHLGDWRTTKYSIINQIQRKGFAPHVYAADGSYLDNLRYAKKGQQEHDDYVNFTKQGLFHADYGKDLDFHEWGVPPATAQEASNKKRKEKDQSFRKAVFNGASDLELAELDWDRYCRQQSGIKALRLHQPPVREEPMLIILHIGDTGVGKTAGCYQLFGRENIYEPPISKDGEINYAGYWRQPVVLMDEFYGKFTLNITLMLLDPHQVREVNAKYGQVWFAPKVLFITSNKHPSTWYNYAGREKQEAALRRRFYDEGLVLENGKKVTNIREWWPIATDRWENDLMPEKHDYDEFIPKFVKPQVNKRVKLSDIGKMSNADMDQLIEQRAQEKALEDAEIEAALQMEQDYVEAEARRWFADEVSKAITQSAIVIPASSDEEEDWVDQILDREKAANPEVWGSDDDDSFVEMVQQITDEDYEQFRHAQRTEQQKADEEFINTMTEGLTDADRKKAAEEEIKDLLVSFNNT